MSHVEGIISVRKVVRCTEHLAFHIFTQGVEVLKHSPLVDRNNAAWLLDHIGELEFSDTAISCVYNHTRDGDFNLENAELKCGSWYAGNGDYDGVMLDLKERLLNVPELKDLFGDIQSAKLIQLNGQEIGLE